MNKLEGKIRKLLGNDYHLFTHCGLVDEPEYWALYRKYTDSDVYFSNDNKAIMTSETHSMIDLYKFAKKHHRIDGIMATRWVICILLFANALLSWSNIFINSKIIRTIVLVNNVDFLIIYFVLFYFWHRNNQIDYLEMKENLMRLNK